MCSVALVAAALISGCGSDEAPEPVPADPDPRSGHALVFDTARGQLLLFGGRAADGLRNDLWVLTGSDWQPLFQGGPPVRRDAVLLYDSGRRRVVLHGGTGQADAPLQDTWEWGGAGWASVPSVGPPDRHAAALAWTGTTNRVLLFGGESPQGQDLRDTWEYDGNAWTLLDSFGPENAALPLMVSDPAISAPLLLALDRTTEPDAEGRYAQSAWRWNGADWLAYDAPVPFSEQRAVVVAGDELLLFDGGDGSTWIATHPGWSRLAETGPGARTGFALAYDLTREAVVLCGGLVEGVPRDDVWLWRDGWTRLR